MISEEQAREIALSHLRSFSLFEETHAVGSKAFDEKLWIGYRTTPQNIPCGTTHFDMNIDGSICYFLYVELKEERMGKGHGRELYAIVEGIAQDLGCDRVCMTPSGWTITGKTRREYMKQLGYVEVGDVEVEKIFG